MAQHVESAAYIRDALMDFQRRTSLTVTDERLIVSARDRVMMLAAQLDEAEAVKGDLLDVLKAFEDEFRNALTMYERNPEEINSDYARRRQVRLKAALATVAQTTPNT